MKRVLIAAALALLASFPLGWIAAMLLTPLLWRLEPILHLELAGHSGPSDWVLFVVWGAMVVVLFLVFRTIIGRRVPVSVKDKH
jgi:hypothetical protein